MYNEFTKNAGGESFIRTSRPLEIVAMDILQYDQQQPIITFIDYYTRIARAKVIKSKEIVKAIEDIVKKLGIPETLITDNGKEMISNEVEDLLRKINIKHHKISPEKHQSNIERLHRDIWQAIRKELAKAEQKKSLKKIMDEIITRQNNSTHRAIKMSLNEAWADPTNEILRIQNGKESGYNKEFKKLRREKFEKGDRVLMLHSELERQNKQAPKI